MKTLREMMDLIESAQQPVAEGIFDRFKKKPEQKSPVNEPITPEERAMIKKFFPETNADMEFGPGRYVLPSNVKANYGVGILSFYKRNGQLKVSLAWHHSEADRANPKAMSLTHVDYDINSAEDLVKIKNILDQKKGVSEDQLEETIDDAIAKIDELTRK